MLIKILHRYSPAVVQRLLKRIQASSVGSRLARGAFWSMVGSVIARAMGLFSGIIVGRILGKHSFGELGMIQSTVGLFSTVAGFGMGTMATRHVAELRQKDPARAGRIIALSSATTWVTSGAMTLVLAIFAPEIAQRTMAAPQLGSLLRIGALLLLLGGVNSAQMGTLSGFEAFRSISRINLYTGLLALPMMLFGAWFYGVAGAVWGLVGNYAFNCGMNWFAVRHETRAAQIVIDYGGCLKEIKVFWKYNLPTLFNSMLYTATMWACGAMVVRQAHGFSGMGIFNAAKRVGEVPELLTTMLMAPVLPVLSELFGRKDMESYGKALVHTYTVCVLVIIPVSLLQIAAPWITMLPYGSDYMGGEPVVRWLVLGSIAYSMLWPVSSILISMGRMWFLFFQVALYTTLYLSLGWLLIPHYGAAGYAMAATTAAITSNIPGVIFLFMQLREVMRQIQWFTMAFLVGVQVVICWFFPMQTNRTATLLLGVISAVIFCAWRILSLRKPPKVMPPEAMEAVQSTP